MIHIQIDSSLDPTNPSFDQYSNLLIAAAEQVLVYMNRDTDSEATIVLTNDKQIQELNKQYLGQDRATDVLAFQAGDSDPDTNILYLGDVVISYPRAKEQAEQVGHALDDELQLLVVHGMLHLLGFDHSSKEEKAVMWDVQSKILTKLGSSLIEPKL